MKLVSQELTIQAPREVVWRHLTEPESFGRWIGATVEFDVRPGGELRWKHLNGDVVRGQFIEVVPFERLTFSYGWERQEVGIPPGSTLVEFALRAAGAATQLSVNHRGLSGAMADAHSAGWMHYLARLRTSAEGVDPGRDSFAASSRVPTSADLGEPNLDPPAEAQPYFRDAATTVTDLDGVTWSTMMGLPCLRLHGDFFASFDQRSAALVVKLPAERIRTLVTSGPGEPFAPAGRVFREWVAVPAAFRAAWGGLLSEAYEFCRARGN